MIAYTEMTAHARLTTLSNNICPQCSMRLFAPECSEHVNERCVRHAWTCDACGYEFETSVSLPLKVCKL